MSAKSPKTPIKIDLSGLKIKDTVNAEDVQIEQPSGAHVKKVNALRNLQYDMIKVEAQFYDELHELECKYAKLYEPFYEKRRQIILGEYEPTESEGKWALDEQNEDENKENVGEKKPATPVKQIQPIDESTLTESGKKLLNDLREQFKVNENGKDEKGIPHFWLETLQSFRMTAELIQEHDEPILEFLRDVRVKLFDKKPYGYTLEFHFDENPYFTNKVLTKTYELKTEVDPKDPFSYEGPDLEKAIGCKIDWLPGKNTTVKLTKTKVKPKNKKGAVKTVTKEEKQDSFFTFFDTPKVTEKSDSKQIALRNEDHDDDEDETDEELFLMADFEIGQYIRE
jgi:nucleosome assembly protein 1-like 1